MFLIEQEEERRMKDKSTPNNKFALTQGRNNRKQDKFKDKFKDDQEDKLKDGDKLILIQGRRSKTNSNSFRMNKHEGRTNSD